MPSSPRAEPDRTTRAPPADGLVRAVHRSSRHGFSKEPAGVIHLLAGLGVQGDAHAGVTVQHRSRVARDPSQANLRQVHLMHAELHDELRAAGFAVGPGDLGENITTGGIALLDLPTGAILHIGAKAEVELTGLRNPCGQLDRFASGLRAACLEHRPDGTVIRKAGVMGIVLTSGSVAPGDPVRVELPTGPQPPLEPV